jgi:hypothetical protein
MKPLALRLLNAILDGRLRKILEGWRIRLDPWGTWLYSSGLDTVPMGTTQGNETRELGCARSDANLLASLVADGNPRVATQVQKHVLVLDIDHPARLVPSTTKGRFHLYVSVPMSWRRYVAVLNALAAADVVHRNYVKHTTERGYTNVRPPWVAKPKNQNLHFGSDAPDD